MSDYPFKEEATEIYSAIGHVVSGWAKVELMLFAFFARLMGLPEAESAAIYYAWQAFERRLNLVNEIMQIRYAGKGELAWWDTLFSYIHAISKERNFIVHNHVELFLQMKERGPDLDAIEVAAAKYTQRSSPYETEHRGKPYREIDKVDIECIEDATFLLCICLNNFSEYLAAPDASRDKYCAPWRDTFLENYLLPLEKRKKLQVRPSTLKV